MLNKLKRMYSHFIKLIDARGWHYEAKIDYLDFKKKTSKKVKLSKSEKKQIRNYYAQYNIKQKEVKLLYFRLYKQLLGECNPKFIPHTLYYKYIDKKFNYDNRATFDDKSYYKLLFKDATQPKTLINCINGTFLSKNYQAISKEDAYQIIFKELQTKPVIFKKSVDSSGGKGIILLKPQVSKEEIDEAFKMGNNFIVQEVIKEHESLSSLHPQSINTIRVMTLLLNGEVHILSTICRIGVGESEVDNVSSGGLCVGVDEQGHLRDRAYSRKDNKYFKTHPLGYAFKDKALPLESLKQVHKLCKTLAYRIPFCQLVSWDFVLSEDGSPLLIESNMTRGGIVIHQMCNGPIFKDLTDEVLTYCLGKRK